MLRHVTSKDPNQYFTHFISNAVSSVRVVVSQKSEVQKHIKAQQTKQNVPYEGQLNTMRSNNGRIYIHWIPNGKPHNVSVVHTSL